MSNSSEVYRKKLIKQLQHAVVPSDSLHFAAIVVMKDGTEFTGVNIKNAVFRDAIYAEQSAIGQAITAGYKSGDFQTMYIMVGSERISDLKYINRAVISEFFEPNAEITCMNLFGEQAILRVDNLYSSVFNY